MKKRMLVLITALGVSVICPVLVKAEVTASYDSYGSVSFKENTDPTNPVDPLDPDPEKPIKPIDPTDPEGKPGGGTPGPLSIDFASSLYFGENTITSENKVYPAVSQKYKDKEDKEQEGPNFVQVTDNRGLETGWTLKVKQNGQFQTKDEDELSAAEIIFSNGNVMTASESPKPTIENTSFSLDPEGSEQLIMAAQAGEGAGTYLMDWGTDVASAKESIHLHVPGSTKKYKKEYKTTFTWILEDTPGQDTEN